MKSVLLVRIKHCLILMIRSAVISVRNIVSRNTIILSLYPHVTTAVVHLLQVVDERLVALHVIVQLAHSQESPSRRNTVSKLV